MFDLILENAKILDGSGKPAYKGDIGIKGVAIEAIGDLQEAEAEKRIDVAGKTVCPGFIDVHSHADLAFFREEHAKILTPLVTQGITTFIGGNCGMALSPITEHHKDGQQLYLEIFTQMDFEKDIRWSDMGSFMEHMDSQDITLNCGLLAPHGVMRISACGMETRLAEKDEVAEMARSLEGCMEAGAFGLSTGLQYFPGNQSDTEELVELGKTVAKYDGIFTSHLRSYTASTLPKAMEEVAEVSRRNGIRGQISHIFSLPWFGPVHKPVLKSLKWLINHPEVSRFIPDFAVEMEMKNILKRLDRLNADSAQVGMDFMPTTAGFTHLMAFFPSWALTGGREAVLKRAADPAARREILEDIENGKPTWPHRGKNDWSLNIMRQMGWDAVTIMAVHSEKNKHLEGRRFTEIGEELGKHPFDVMCDLLLEEEGRVLVFESMSEPDDIFTETYTFPAVRHPNTMVVTDTILMGIGKPSYLFYGCYPKFINRYVFEKKLVDLPSAIRRCTSLPAEWFGIRDRGQVREGYFADLLVLDAPNFKTEAVFRDPERYTEGLEMVMINGQVVLEGGGVEPKALAGKMLRK